ncbi:carboxyl-terminal-processing peptidase 1, chloroplastic [Dorcoceras hygrometricum]|uniref:Carboxyl-terminal-processing peptidase 1, chloroplastic n=1 Tax=Dorcoceras hygrometricum TaxID=472368 RepID=A0A2Z7D9R3_9LAMI|nr:carboxyl-terminal-processing peptidase 1, chloroplastic [Dorcoceras hygrometricum]
MQTLTSPSRLPCDAHDQRPFNRFGRLLRPHMAGTPPAGPPPGPVGSNETSLGPSHAPHSSNKAKEPDARRALRESHSTSHGLATPSPDPALIWPTSTHLRTLSRPPDHEPREIGAQPAMDRQASSMDERFEFCELWGGGDGYAYFYTAFEGFEKLKEEHEKATVCRLLVFLSIGSSVQVLDLSVRDFRCVNYSTEAKLAVGPQPLRLRNHNFGLAQRIMVKRLATSPHDPLGITDSVCKNQLVVVSVQYGPFNPCIPIRSTTIGKSRVAKDPIAMHTSWRSNSDIASVTSIGYPRMSASGESSTTKHRLLHASGSHPILPPNDPNTTKISDLSDIHACQRAVNPRQRSIDSYMHRDLTQSCRLMTPSESANESK